MKKIKIKLVKDSIGGSRLETENGELLQNLFLKSYERIKDSVIKLNLEALLIAPKEKGRNW